MADKVVWIIDAEHWPRALLRAELLERGFDAVGFETYADAIENLPWRRPDAIVVETRGQPVAQIRRLLNLGVPVILTGGAPEIEDPAYAVGGWGAVMRRPVTLGQIADAVGEAITDNTKLPD